MRHFATKRRSLSNLVRAGSAILDPNTKEHWEQIQRSDGGTARLLRSFEDYANTLAQNLRKTYLKPFTIVTDNMSTCCKHLCAGMCRITGRLFDPLSCWTHGHQITLLVLSPSPFRKYTLFHQ
uniref:AGRL2-4 GAIN subdomain A domain-containing protein n=1 Tax=Oryzias sinensis TaxID=183150 RepID=A0A8C7WV00_9TELE